jgi:glycoprotein-N-acetylgalactosamine 3-beta-galactosyltransferase
MTSIRTRGQRGVFISWRINRTNKNGTQQRNFVLLRSFLLLFVVSSSYWLHLNLSLFLVDKNKASGLLDDLSSWRLRQSSTTSRSDLLLSCPDPTGPQSLEGEGGRQVLEKVRNGLLKSQAFLKDKNRQQQQQKRLLQPRVLCMVYTHEGSHDHVRAIYNTWGRRCDGFWAASNVTDESIGAIHLPHQGPESYTNMWQKVRSMWAYAYDHYLDQFDYFHICGDDVYMVLDNLQAYVASEELQRLQDDGHLDIFATHHYASAHKWASVQPRPLLLGVPIFYRKSGTYPLGGPGYTLNQRALQLFMEEGFSIFLPNQTDPREDVFMGSFFAEKGIWTSDTRDKTGAWRYAGNGDAEASFQFDGTVSQLQTKKLAQKYKGYDYPTGLEGVSEQTVSFHLKRKGRPPSAIPDLIYRYHDILYRSDHCENNINNNQHSDEPQQVKEDRHIVPNEAAAVDLNRPKGLRLVMLGDSVDRYQYLSLAYFLRWGVWYGEKNEANEVPSFRSLLFHEKDGGTWNEFMAESNKILSPYESCDCYR